MVFSDACQNPAARSQSQGLSSAAANLSQALAPSAMGSGALGPVFFWPDERFSLKDFYEARLQDGNEVYDKVFSKFC